MAAEKTKAKGKGRYITWFVAIALVVYIGFMLGPYLRSTLIRDAAVTTWIHLATSPIYGEVAEKLPKPGDRIGEGGQIVRVRNAKADRSQFESALADVDEAENLVAAAETYLAELDQLRTDRKQQFEEYRATFIEELNEELVGLDERLHRGGQELEALKRLTARKESLASSGSAALSDLDESRTRSLALERHLEGLRSEERKLLTRLAAAKTGTIILDDGSDPDWGARTLHELDAAIAEASYQLAEAKARLANAETKAAAEDLNFKNLTEGHVKAPKGAVLWSTIVGEGAAVDVGTPVASWIDCEQLLVDVPVADAEVPLLQPGTRASVIFEGEAKPRDATVYLTRGSASTIKADDLAALAKGREAGVAQALLVMDLQEEDKARCPVGHAAYVDFPDIGLIDVILARLRL